MLCGFSSSAGARRPVWVVQWPRMTGTHTLREEKHKTVVFLRGKWHEKLWATAFVSQVPYITASFMVTGTNQSQLQLTGRRCSFWSIGTIFLCVPPLHETNTISMMKLTLLLLVPLRLLILVGCFNLQHYCHAFLVSTCNSCSPTRTPSSFHQDRVRSHSVVSLSDTTTTSGAAEGCADNVSSTDKVGSSEPTQIQLPRYDHANDEGYPSVLHFIDVKPILTTQETTRLLELARQHAAATGRWQQPDTARHATYATCDFAIDEAPAVQAYLDDLDFDERVFTTLSELYDIPGQDLSYLDLFCAQYRAKKTKGDDEEDDGTMDQLEAHRDGSLLSFTITLSDPNDFEGGGTFFEALRGHEDEHADTGVVYPGGVIRPTRAGDGVFHSGKPLHGADRVTAGERVVLVGFVNVAGWRQRPGVLAQACTTWGRMDVAQKHHQRQVEKTQSVNGGNATAGWYFAKNRSKWLSGCSYMGNYCPAFSTVARRADPIFQRLQRLQAEDGLLRNILLTQQEVDENLAEFDGLGEITIL